MKADAALIKGRTGGVIKFRIPALVLKKKQFRLGTKAVEMMNNQRCGFCCEHKTNEQICTARGRRGKKLIDIAWTWICQQCKEKVGA